MTHAEHMFFTKTIKNVQVRGTLDLLSNSIVAFFCRLGLMVGEVFIEMSLLVHTRTI